MTAAHRHSFRQAAQAIREDIHASTVTIAGIPYACAAVTSEITPELDQITLTERQVQTAVIRIRRTLLPIAPAGSTKVILSGLEWFITSIGSQDANGHIWQIKIKRIIRKTA